MRRLLTGLDEAVIKDDLQAARSLLLQAEIAFAETGIRRKTIPDTKLLHAPPPVKKPSPPINKRSR